ncbi:restriction endonuclease subunit S [Burkholderia gladioli]|uniref:restriction endonuclease subunit S n=1 Tax=Burkholderia gladioli TaxID=28095 RepID=UPI00163FCA3A|nr:restriction endonuclease subunit S [Burkholderia gladioli]MBJ9714633.1 restriction endonuclease subunit S [Burkholderia gladioli]MDZ4038922.1 restriction endonuclease subunit S [Burkholderia gladioli pv. alliicola]
MWIGEVCATELFGANRWTVSFFSNAEQQATNSAFPMRPLGELAEERRGSSDPQKLGDIEITYLGLENIRSITGELVDFAPRVARSIKSRSKIFRRNDVLYGRLRPELNKVFLAQGEVEDGLCSGEFIVLVPKTNLVLPRYFRHALASSFVTKFAEKFRAGASLPRIAADDLLSIEIPVPPIEVQTEMVDQLIEIDNEIVRLRSRLEKLPGSAERALLKAISSGTSAVDPVL